MLESREGLTEKGVHAVEGVVTVMCGWRTSSRGSRPPDPVWAGEVHRAERARSLLRKRLKPRRRGKLDELSLTRRDEKAGGRGGHVTQLRTSSPRRPRYVCCWSLGVMRSLLLKNIDQCKREAWGLAPVQHWSSLERRG